MQLSKHAYAAMSVEVSRAYIVRTIVHLVMASNLQVTFGPLKESLVCTTASFIYLPPSLPDLPYYHQSHPHVLIQLKRHNSPIPQPVHRIPSQHFGPPADDMIIPRFSDIPISPRLHFTPRREQ